MTNEQVNKKMLRKIGEGLKKARQENNMTIREIASEFGVTQNTICNFESGKSNNLILFLKYCYFFEVRIGGEYIK